MISFISKMLFHCLVAFSISHLSNNVEANKQLRTPPPTPSPTPPPPASLPLHVLIQTYLNDGVTPHPLGIISPQESAIGNVAHLTLIGDGHNEDFVPDMDDEACTYCDRFFGMNAVLGNAYNEAKFVGGAGAMIRGPPYPGVYTLVWRNTDIVNVKKVKLTVEVACNDGIHCNGEERFIQDKCVSGYHVDFGEGFTPYMFGLNNEQVHRCYEGAPWIERVANGSEQDDCGPICVPKCTKGQKCGDGGCPRGDAEFCGSCESGYECKDGGCVVILGPSDSPGICMNPLNILHGLTFANGTTWDQPSGPTDFFVPAKGIVGC